MDDLPQNSNPNPPNEINPEPKLKRRNRLLSYKKKDSGKRYTPVEKLAVAAMLKAGKTPTEIERESGIDRSTVYDVKKDKRYQIIDDKKLDDIKRSLLGMTFQTAHRAQEKITDDKLDASSALQLMTISAIGIDKGRLMSDMATQIIKIDKDDIELDRELEAKKEELRRISEAKVIDVSAQDVNVSTRNLNSESIENQVFDSASNDA